MQYRARIGSFNLKRKTVLKPTNKKYKCQTYPTKYCTKGPSVILQIMIVYLLFATLLTIEHIKKNSTKSSRSCISSIHPFNHENGMTKYNFRNVSNFEARYVNGNRISKGVKICHWNKGNSSYENKIVEIKNIKSISQVYTEWQ